MSQNQERRVLNRMGARQLSVKECEQVQGAIIRSSPCTVDLKTGVLDNDCPIPF